MTMTRNEKGQFVKSNSRLLDFYSKITNKSKIEECWEWLGGKDWDGYGMFWFINRNIRAARYSYEQHVAKIPKGLLVCHKCDNPSCVNPHHLFLGTAKDNTLDMISKNRGTIKKGEYPEHLKKFKGINHPRAKLTKEQIKEIRNNKIISVKEMAKKYLVSISCIYLIKSKINWKDI